nr:MAG TPA: hypothetical protein [Caudoviricetes sp.]
MNIKDFKGNANIEIKASPENKEVYCSMSGNPVALIAALTKALLDVTERVVPKEDLTNMRTAIGMAIICPEIVNKSNKEEPKND